MRAYDDSSDEEDKEDIDLEIVMGKMYEAMHVVPPQQDGYIIHPPPITLEEIQRMKHYTTYDPIGTIERAEELVQAGILPFPQAMVDDAIYNEPYTGHPIFRHDPVPTSKDENEQKEFDVELISKQLGCSDKDAEEALKKANGDIVDAILSIEIK